MGLNHLSPRAMTEIDDDDKSTIYNAAATPPETTFDDFDDQDPLSTPKISPSSVPWPGTTYIIRSASTGHVLTLEAGNVVLTPPGGRGSIHWACVETKGWMGFKNTVSGRFLGHDPSGKLHCNAAQHQGWENFEVRLRPDGGYVLLMTHFERLWYVGFKKYRGLETLAKIGDGADSEHAIVWEFVKV